MLESEHIDNKHEEDQQKFGAKSQIMNHIVLGSRVSVVDKNKEEKDVRRLADRADDRKGKSRRCHFEENEWVAVSDHDVVEQAGCVWCL